MTDQIDITKQLNDPELKGEAWQKKARELGLKPGMQVPGTDAWIPWIESDLDKKDTVTFVCQDVLGGQGGSHFDSNGTKFFVLDINGLQRAFIPGKLQTVNRFFYSRYEAMVNDNIKLEELKRGGSDKMGKPWDRWFYTPNAATFGMDIDGKYLKDPKWYELTEDGIPVRINNIKALALLFFEGNLDFTFTKAQLLELIFIVYKMKFTAKIKKLLRRK